jgi:rhodanese/phosphatase family protein
MPNEAIGTLSSLLRAADMPAVPGLEVPSEFYTIAMNPAPIAGMEYPSASTPWSAIANLGFRHVICLAAINPTYQSSPLRIAHAIDLQDLVSGGKPRDPDREERFIRNAVEVAIDKIRLKEGLVIHCLGGTGRTGTVIGCLLRALGYDGRTVVDYLRVLNEERGRHWPESSRQADLVLGFRMNA